MLSDLSGPIERTYNPCIKFSAKGPLMAHISEYENQFPA